MRNVLIVILMAFVSVATFAEDWDKATEGLTARGGLATVYTDTAKGKVYLALPAPDAQGISARYIYVGYLGAGLGSNPMGLDRGAGSKQQILAFKRTAGKVIAIAENHDFRATADNVAEQMSVQKAFAQSALWAGDIVAEEPETGRLLVDITSFLLRDTMNVAARLKARDQGSFKMSKELSFVDAGATLVFPRNMEFDATVTFTSDKPGREVIGTTPVASNVTLVAHTSFVALPEDGYKTRLFDERAAQLTASYVDMSSPLGGGVVTRLAARFRLEKTDPSAVKSRVKNPIVFYVDNAAPEPIRSALVEGANWWQAAFEAAGFIDAYRVEVLPEGAHPQDVRYNVINWVHRATRGWSYGASVRDPRTGEIIRGYVLLGSLRVRQDIKILEGLAGTQASGTGSADDPIELALDRIRQLAAHEVGHSLGFAHNMAASTYMNRGSVMDYPAPLVHASGGKLDFSDAYSVGIGPWDKWTVTALYREYQSDEAEKAGMKALIKEADAKGMIFVKDEHSRSISSGHWKGSLWDNGTEPVAGLQEVIAVRKIALGKFGMNVLKEGERISALQDKIVPIYLYHRYQVQAAAKVIGGMDYAYSLKGDGRQPSKMLSAAKQQAALNIMLQTLEPEFLDLREELLSLLSPIGSSDGDAQFRLESFGSATTPAFDHLQAAAIAADITLDALLHPARADRLVSFKARDDSQLGLQRVLDGLINDSFKQGRDSARHAPLRRIVQERVVAAIIKLASNEATSNDVRVISAYRLNDLAVWLEKSRGREGLSRQHFLNLAATIRRFNARRVQPVSVTPAAPTTPPGSPIGSEEQCWHCN